MLDQSDQITKIQGEVRTSLQDMLSLQLELNKQISEKEQMEALYEKRFTAMKEFLNYLKFTPYFKDIMNEFNDKSKSLIMYMDDEKNVRLREDVEN